MSDSAVCSICGFANGADANFCSACGSALSKGSDQDTGRIPAVAVDAPMPGAVGQLIVTRGPTAGARFAMTDVVTRLGRGSDSQVFLDDITVSRNHAEIQRKDDGTYELTDSGSLNGTYLNGERVKHALLREGAQLQIGKFHLVFVIGSLGGPA